MIRVGVRAHDFGKLPADELAARIAAKGLCCVQLAVSKAIEGINLSPGDLTAGLGFHVGQAFLRHGVQIAVLGCYINLSQPDPAARRPLIELFKNHLRYARDFGCSIVATETGSLNPDWSFHPDNHTDATFATIVPTIAELVAEAQHFGVIVGIEGVTSHVLNSPQKIRRLLDRIASNNLQVVFDPVNLLNFDNYKDQERVIKESFDLFGDRIAIVHAKDFAVDGPALRQVRTGQGLLNYRLLMELLKQRKPGISILLEESSEATAAECVGYIKAAAGA